MTDRGSLYVVSTPIGNLGDLTLRAIETLRAVRLVAAEDTRHTRKLLSHLGIRVRLVSYHAHNRQARTTFLLEQLALGDIALVSDAGTPVVSDPGQELVTAAASAGHAVIPIPGPSALTAALAVSGLQTTPSHFLGFLPRRTSERRAALEMALEWPGAFTFFEAPHRLRKTLAELAALDAESRLAVCWELTKLYEGVFRGTAAGAVAHFEGMEPRGEFTLVVEPSRHPLAVRNEEHAPDARTRLTQLMDEYGDRNRALAQLSRETGIPRKELYQQLLVTKPAQET